MSKVDELGIDIQRLYQWYMLNGSPTRRELRELERDRLPISKTILEGLLPYFTNLKDKHLVFNPQDEKEEISIVVCSDFHIPFQDRECIATFLNFLKEYQPDELILNGNINDCTSFSTHPKIKDVAIAFHNGKKEREEWFRVADLIRDTLPSTKIIYIGSQCHEGWIDKWRATSPILLEDDNYDLENWFRLSDYNIEFEKETYKPWNDNSLIITHGTISRGKSGASSYATMEQEGTSIIQAHTHKLSQVYKTTTVGTNVAVECGCMCQRTPWYYLKGRRLMMDWQQGFCLVNGNKNSFSTSIIPVIRDDNDKPIIIVGKDKFK